MRGFILGLMLAVIGVTAAAACTNPMRREVFIYPGFKTFPAPETPPEIAYLRADGSTARLDTLRGKPSVVTFWFPKCPGCQQEGPSLNAMLDERKARGEINFLALSVQGDREEAVRYLAERGYASMDPNIDPDAALFGALCFRATPVHLILNAQAQMVAVLVGPQDWQGANSNGLLDTLVTKGGI